ncbi:MAG: transcriptional/translational regulatory protein YebC/TACO1, partial [Granulosicoccus sp.]
SYLFEKQGVLNFPSGSDEDTIMEAALEAGADDIITEDDGSIEVLTTAESFVDVKEALIAGNLVAEHSEVTMRAATSVELDVEQGQKLLKLIDALEDLDDVQDVFTNAEIPGDAYA